MSPSGISRFLTCLLYTSKSDEFKRDLDDVINALRSEEYGLLQSRSQMVRYGRENKESEMQGAYTTEFGFRADTEKYAFLLRCIPVRGDYNFFCFCYVKEWLDKHIEEANRDIRFIDSHYKELFRIPDGERIIVTDRDGKTESYPLSLIHIYMCIRDSLIPWRKCTLLFAILFPKRSLHLST